MSASTLHAAHATTPPGLVAIYLPEQVATMLSKEAKAQHKPVADTIAQWLEDQADGREAVGIIERIATGKEAASPAADVWARLGV